MIRHLCTVEEVFAIANRGVVFVPGFVPVGNERFRIGDPLLLKRPDGTVLATSIAGLGLCSPNPRREIDVLLHDLTKQDIPVGTEVWSAVAPGAKNGETRE